MVENVFIQCEDDGDFPNVALFNAAKGFEFIGREVIRMTPDEIEGRTPRAEDLVFGGVEVVRPYLAKLGCEPDPVDYPLKLQKFLGRKFETETLGVIRKRYNEPGPPIFIKPVEHKLFTGHVVRRFGDLIRTQSLPAETLLYCVEHMEFLSEWRFYGDGDRVVGVDHYKGEPLLAPDAAIVAQAASAFAEYDNGPATYSLDFGVSANGQTRLVEVNDMIALGCYGLEAPVYAQLIEKRWRQLVAHLLQ
jgi:hypothetical protein